MSLTAIVATASIAASAQPTSRVRSVPEGVLRLINIPAAAKIQNDVSANRPKIRADGIGRDANVTIPVPITAGRTIIKTIARDLLEAAGDNLRSSQPAANIRAPSDNKPIRLRA